MQSLSTQRSLSPLEIIHSGFTVSDFLFRPFPNMHRATYCYVLANQWVVHFAVHTPEHPVHVIDKNKNMLYDAPSMENNLNIMGH